MSFAIQDIYQKYPVCKGELKQTVYADILDRLLPLCDGDLCEIGAYDGRSTMVFLERAKQFGRKVYVIDPWDGNQEGSQKAYSEFLENTKMFDNLGLLRLSSQNEIAVKYISNLSLCFCLIDGMHNKQVVTHDIITVQNSKFNCGLIIIDDVRDLYGSLGKTTCAEIMDAVNQNENKQWKHVLSPNEWLGTCYVKEC